MSKPPNVFDDEAKAAFIDLVKSGFLRYESARRLGFKLATIKKHYAADPEFAEALDEAVLEATEPVERVLYDAALRGEPWATGRWLTKRDKDRWGDEPIKVEHQLEIGPGLQGIALLINALQERHALRQAESEKLHQLSAGAPPIDVEWEVLEPETAKTRPNPRRKAPPV